MLMIQLSFKINLSYIFITTNDRLKPMDKESTERFLK